MAAIPMPSKAQIDAEQKRKQEKEIQADIFKIKAALQDENCEGLLSLHKYMDGKYQAAIIAWGSSMYGYFEGHGFNYEFLGLDSIKENLNMMIPKLESFANGWNAKSNYPTVSTGSDVNVTVNNTVNISVSFEEARQKIEDMTALSREQTDEILEKIEELEQISKETSSRKTKWEKVKPIIAFVMDKGADVAVAILTLIVQMKLGG